MKEERPSSKTEKSNRRGGAKRRVEDLFCSKGGERGWWEKVSF